MPHDEEDDDIFNRIFAAQEGRFDKQSAESRPVQTILSNRDIGISKANNMARTRGDLAQECGVLPNSRLFQIVNIDVDTGESENDIDTALDHINRNPLRFPSIWDDQIDTPDTCELRVLLANRQRSQQDYLAESSLEPEPLRIKKSIDTHESSKSTVSTLTDEQISSVLRKTRRSTGQSTDAKDFEHITESKGEEKSSDFDDRASTLKLA